MFVRNKSIIKTFLTKIWIHNIASWFGPNQERNLHRSSTVYKPKTVQNSSKQICGWILMWGSSRYTFLEGFVFTNTQLLSSQDVNWWTGVVWITWGLLWCFYHLFGLSFWRHPFTAEHQLLSKWCNDTFLQIYIMDGLRVNIFSANFHFWVNYSFKHLHLFQFI